MTGPLRLMAVLAHPDDESLGVGGTFARYGAEGVATALVTATRGQGGRFRGLPKGDPGHPGPGRLAEIRDAELRAAVGVLGISDFTQLGHVDGALDEADPVAVAGQIASHLRRFRPQVVLTFAPDGAYGHPDHVAICQLTTAATVAAADPAHADPLGHPAHAVSKLYYMATDAESAEAYQAAFRRLTVRVDGVEREVHPWPAWAITTRVDTRAHWETVWKAVTCHDSQIAGYQALRTLAPHHHEALWGSQRFYRAFSTVNGGRAQETDLFEGLREGGS